MNILKMIAYVAAVTLLVPVPMAFAQSAGAPKPHKPATKNARQSPHKPSAAQPRAGRTRHQRNCATRFKSYDIRSDTYLAGGRRRRCKL